MPKMSNSEIDLGLDSFGYADMDALIAEIKKLPKVQQSMIYLAIEEQFYQRTKQQDNERSKACADWVYS